MERRCLHHVVARAVPREMPRDAEREPKLRADAAAALRVERQVAGDRDDVDARDVGPGGGSHWRSVK